jgi:hypothetical protein
VGTRPEAERFIGQGDESENRAHAQARYPSSTKTLDWLTGDSTQPQLGDYIEKDGKSTPIFACPFAGWLNFIQ